MFVGCHLWERIMGLKSRFEVLMNFLFVLGELD